MDLESFLVCLEDSKNPMWRIRAQPIPRREDPALICPHSGQLETSLSHYASPSFMDIESLCPCVTGSPDHSFAVMGDHLPNRPDDRMTAQHGDGEAIWHNKSLRFVCFGPLWLAQPLNSDLLSEPEAQRTRLSMLTLTLQTCAEEKRVRVRQMWLRAASGRPKRT